MTEGNENEKYNYYKYAYPSYIIDESNESKSDIIKNLFTDIEDYVSKHAYKIGLYDTNKDIKEIESNIKKYYSCSDLGDNSIKTYQKIVEKFLPNLISKISKAINDKVLDKELCSSLFTHFFIILRDFMDKVEEIKK